MKKVLLLLLGSTSAAWAQDNRPTHTFGIKLAYGRTSLGGKNTMPYDATSHSAYQAGLVADVYLSDVVSFHPELLYTMRYFDAQNEAYNRDLTYLDLPLLARYHTGGLFFEAGPQLSAPLTAKNEAGDNVKSEVHNVALNYVAGLGYQFRGGPSLGLRYDGGITSAFKSNTPVLGPDKLKTHTVLLAVGYTFGGGSVSWDAATRC